MNNNNKRRIMNNLKKLGVTALAGSLVAVSAQAGEMGVNGSANFTWAQADGTEGKSIGSDKGFTVSGSGELDNGWTVAVLTYLSDTMTMSSHVTTLTMGSMGSLKVGQGYGGAGSAYDEEVPQAYEQTSDAFQNSANLVGAYLDNNSLVWDSPSYDMGGGTVSLDLAISPDATDSAVSNGGQGAHTGIWGLGYGAGITMSNLVEGLTLGVYGDIRENVQHKAVGADGVRDQFGGTWYAKYSAGPVSFGYQSSYFDSGLTGAAIAAASPATVGTSGGVFEAENMSIAFNVNDNLSISWTDTEDTYDAQAHDTGTIVDVSKDTDALQVAYSMGGMSIKAYRMTENNPNYDSDATDKEKSEISLGLAF
jgi:outer membrane protein OmpU